MKSNYANRSGRKGKGQWMEWRQETLNIFVRIERRDIGTMRLRHRPKINWTQYGNPFLEANISPTKPPTKAFDLPPNLFFRQTLVEKFHAIKAGFSSCSPPKFLRLKDCYSWLSLLFVIRVSSFKILINPFKTYF